MSVAGQEDTSTEPEVVESTETVTVDRDEPEDREPAQRTDGAANDEPRESRKDRRIRETREMKESTARAEAAERRATETEARIRQIEQQNAELRGWAQAQNQRGQGNEAETKLREKISGFRRQAQGHLERAATAAKAGDKATYEREIESYHEAIEDAAAEKYAARERPKWEQTVQERIQQATAGIVTPRQMAIRETVATEFPWVRTDEIARDAVDGEINRLVAQGRPLEDVATIREACAKIAKRMNIGGRQAPSDASRQRFAGVRAGEGGSASGDGRIVVGRAEEKLAQASFPHLEKKDAIKAWAKEMAKSQRPQD